jgi:hypothetical protein
MNDWLRDHKSGTAFEDEKAMRWASKVTDLSWT